MAITTRSDAVQYVEERLGADGSRALAEVFCTITRWQTVDQLTDAEWSNVLNDAIPREADGEPFGDEVTLADESAPREDRIAAAARLCRAADDEQAVESDSEMTWESSAEQAGTIETMTQACGGKPTRDDWQTFGRHY